MAMSLDKQHAAYNPQQQIKTASVYLHGHRPKSHQQQASSSAFIDMNGKRGPKAYTEVCGIFSPSLNDPPLQPAGNKPRDEAQYRCPRCDFPYSRPYAVKSHFPRCIKDNGNPRSLRWFDYDSNDDNGIQGKENSDATVTSRKRKRGGYGEAHVLVAMSKVAKWATMAAEKQAANIVSTSNNSNDARHITIYSSTAVAESAPPVSSNRDKSKVHQSTLTPTTTPKQRKSVTTPSSRNEYVTQPCEQNQPGSQKSRKSRQPTHDAYTAHRFNSAGVLIPSIPGVDPVMERLFDQGKIMSLGPSRPHDSYYPDGGPRGGSFLLELSEH